MPPLHEYVVAPVPDRVTGLLPTHTLVDVAEIPTTGNGLIVTCLQPTAQPAAPQVGVAPGVTKQA